MPIDQSDLQRFIEAITPRKITMSRTEGLNMTFDIQQFRENAELYYRIVKTLVDFSEEKGGPDLARHYRSIENQSDKALQFICGNHILFENIARDYQAETSMKNLQGGDIMYCINDGSKGKFLHYRPVDTGKYTMEPQSDKNYVHVRMWDNETNDWKTGDHEEFLTRDFRKD